ncbi:hypothetical protein DPEC_G00275800 [Dallia pectoralis]|uniref:Uncharacterized protein n=1 Tax=Dallia pectoralis TaxID=75939 RepID=A0ACC2FLP1_DALPE|nr:hypothetical protein DPEC_G00275800 [Dallia pectoralis]
MLILHTGEVTQPLYLFPPRPCRGVCGVWYRPVKWGSCRGVCGVWYRPVKWLADVSVTGPFQRDACPAVFPVTPLGNEHVTISRSSHSLSVQAKACGPGGLLGHEVVPPVSVRNVTPELQESFMCLVRS